ncbi:MAG: WbqC family protein [Crocinitomicaceae bacterium]|nr:WbqC family protein [Crocinitomicaceae bacterium]
MIPVLPSSYFGSIAYFRELAKHDIVRIEAKEHFPKQTYRNRCDILAGDGILSLSIPIKRPDGSKTATDRILLSDEENWRIRHWRSLTSAYQSAAFFDYYSIEVKELLFNDSTTLLEFNTKLTQRIIDWLDLNTRLELTNEFAPILEKDPRAYLLAKDAYQSTMESPYIQVFPSETSYRESLSILDAIFCEGPLARKLLIQ